MSAYDTLISNIDKTAYTSVWDMDKIIAARSGSFVSPAPVAGPPGSTTVPYTTSFGDTYYFRGIYSIDNGVTWNDFNSMIPNLSTPATPVFQTLDVGAAVGSSGTFSVIAFNYYDAVHGVGTAYNILWKAILFSKNNQGAITPEIIPDPTLFTSIARNYQKIAIKDQVTFDVVNTAGNSVTITHNLGYVPRVWAFYQQTSPAVRLDALWAGYKIDTQVSETTVRFVLDAARSTITASGRIEYRIYYER